MYFVSEPDAAMLICSWFNHYSVFKIIYIYTQKIKTIKHWQTKLPEAQCTCRMDTKRSNNSYASQGTRKRLYLAKKTASSHSWRLIWPDRKFRRNSFSHRINLASCEWIIMGPCLQNSSILLGYHYKYVNQFIKRMQEQNLGYCCHGRI